MTSQRIGKHLENGHPALFAAYCMTAAFGAYSCMYAFRKPFTAGTYEGLTFGTMGYKSALVFAQILGYTLSKFIGIRVVAELPRRNRAMGILVLIGIAQAALLLFGLIPAPWNLLCLFLNGLPLGMVFGLVLGFLEGRRLTEALTAGLCASFIVSSGLVKSVGQFLILDWGISEFWMPFLTGCIFTLPLLVCVWMLAQIPPPSKADIAHRAERPAMDRAARQHVLRRHAPGLVLVVAAYLLLTTVRGVRDDFAVEIWKELGYAKQPDVFTTSEMLVALAVLALTGAAAVVSDNRRAFHLALASICVGFCGLVAIAILFARGGLGPFPLMVGSGIALYVPYVAFHTSLFERMIAVFRERANLGFLMYLADAFGYLGYVALIVFRNFAAGSQIDFLKFFLQTSLWAGSIALVLVAAAWLWFWRRLPSRSEMLVPNEIPSQLCSESPSE